MSLAAILLMLRRARILVILVYIADLCLPLPELLNRTSDASQALFGRYSPLYTALLSGYLLVIAMWIAVAASALGLRPTSQWRDRLLRRGEMLFGLMIAMWVFHFTYLLVFVVWALSQDAGKTALLGAPLSALAVLAAAPPDGRRLCWRSAPVAFGATLICLLALEVGLRVLFPFGMAQARLWVSYGEPTPWRRYVGWAPPANSSFYDSSPGEFYQRIDINSHGLRDYEYAYEKPTDTFRILILGDSMTFAEEVELDQTYQQVLERRLNEVGAGKVEVIAGAVGGWSNDQELLYLRHEGCRYQPDLVLLQFTTNDVSGNNSRALQKPYFTLSEAGELVVHRFPHGDQSSDEATSAMSALNPFLLRSHTVRIVWQLVDAAARSYTSGRRTNAAGANVIQAEPDEPRQPDWKLTEVILSEIQREVEKCGAVMAGFPDAGMARLRPDSEQKRQMTTNLMNLYLDTLKRLNVPHPSFEQITTPFDDYVRSGKSIWDLTFPFASHHTALGYRMLGDVVADWIIKSRLIPLT